MSDNKRTPKNPKDQKKRGTRIKDLAPPADPKGGEMKTPLRPDLPRGGWDGNHNLTAV